MVEKLEADTKHVEHVQDFWSDPLTASGAQSNDGKAAYVQVYLRRQPGRGAGQRVGRGRPEHRRRHAAAAGREGLRHRSRGAGRRPAHRRRPKHADDRGGHVHGHHRDAAARLPVDRHGAADPRHGRARSWPPPAVSWRSSATTRSSGSRRSPPTCWSPWRSPPATDYAIFLIGRYQEARGGGRGPRTRLLHHVPRDGARGAGLGSDHRRRDVLPAASPGCRTSSRSVSRWRSAWWSVSWPR